MQGRDINYPTNLSLRVDATLKRWITRQAKRQRMKPGTLARTLLEDAAARARQAQEVARDADD